MKYPGSLSNENSISGRKEGIAPQFKWHDAELKLPAALVKLSCTRGS